MLMQFGFRVANYGLLTSVKHQTRAVILINAFCLLFFINSEKVLAQAEPESYSRFGVGGQAGIPTGLTVKYYITRDISVMAVNAWSLDRFLRFSTNAAYETPIPDSPLHFYLGPGLFIGRENSSKQTDFKVGFTLVAGVNFYIEKFEVFLQTNPDFAVRPDISIQLGGVVGLRYFF